MQHFEGVAQKGCNFLKGGSDNCFHYVYKMKKKKDFISLDTLSGKLQALSPLNIPKNNTPYFDMNL